MSEDGRDDDPFEDVVPGEGTAAGDGSDSTDEGSTPTGDESGAPDAESSGDGFEWDLADDAEAAPLDDLAERIRDREATRSAVDETTSDEDLFERVEVSDIDREQVWATLESDDGEAVVGVGGAAEEVDETGGVPEHVVEKAEYCQQCPHFAAPPETACTHEGTEIVEVVDAEHFLVRACPVAERDGPGENPL